MFAGPLNSGSIYDSISGSMLANISESIFTPATILWFIAALIAATLLFGAINRRRGRLTDSLKEYVDQNKTNEKVD